MPDCQPVQPRPDLPVASAVTA